MRFLAIMTTALMLAQPVLADQPSTLTVSGTGHVTRAPDMATLMVGVTTQGDTASEALGANSDQLAAVMARLKEAGIAENDIQTSGLSLNPRYESSSSGDAPVIHGYEAANTVSVTVHDLDALAVTSTPSIRSSRSVRHASCSTSRPTRYQRGPACTRR